MHDSDATIMGYLCIGEGDYDEITEEYAREVFPEAFLGNGESKSS